MIGRKGWKAVRDMYALQVYLRKVEAVKRFEETRDLATGAKKPVEKPEGK